MKKIITVISMLVVFLHTSFGQEVTGEKAEEIQTINKPLEVDKSSVVDLFTQKANDIGLKVTFRLDKFDDSILIIDRETLTRPENLKDWDNFFISLNTDKKELKHDGFKWVRIYTLASTDESHFLLIIL